MKIAILTSGILPIPAVQGGAVENLVDFYLEYNNCHRIHDITVYSVLHPEVEQHPSLLSEVNHYHYIDTSSIKAKIRRNIFRLFHKNKYYNYFIEYFFEEAYKDIKKKKYDCILLENRPGYVCKLTQYKEYKIILHLHNDLLNHNTKSHQIIFDNLYQILTVSSYIKNRVSTITNTNKIQVIHNGIDLQRFSTNQNSLLNRGLIGFNDNDFILIFSGRMNRDKGITELVKAMNLLKDYQPIKLMVIGSSFFADAANDNAFTTELKDKAKPLKGRIIFTGFIPYSQMPDYLKMADVAVIPSVWDDPFPTTVLEAQAMGLPIITTRRGGIPEEVTEENAIMLETDEHFVNNIAAAILDLYEHPEKRKQMSEASLKRSRLFDKETYAKNFLAALERIK